MKKNNKKAKHEKKTKQRINKRKLFIVALVVLFVGIGLVKATKLTINGVVKIKDNVTTLTEAIFGTGEDTSKVNKEKQFDLEDENMETKKKYVVYLDVGHGGSDSGYVSQNKVAEKDLDLEIARKVSNILSSQGDISVIVSRNTDINLSNKNRVEDGNMQNADVFVSIHMSSNEDPTAEGIQTFYRGDSNDASDELATLVQKSVISYVNLKDRGAHAFTFDVLKGNNMPAILIECGFLSNPQEEKKLTNEKFQSSLSEGIAQGILSFLDTQGK